VTREHEHAREMDSESHVQDLVPVEVGNGDSAIVESFGREGRVRPALPMALAVTKKDDGNGRALARRAVDKVHKAVAVHVAQVESVSPLASARQACTEALEANRVGCGAG